MDKHHVLTDIDIEKKANIACECGRTTHQKEAKYCGDCGKKLEKAAATTFSKK